SNGYLSLYFCIEGRQKVKDYVIERYGKECVSEIITFDLMKARGAVRDTGRAMNMPYALCDKIAKMIDPRRTIKETLEAGDGEDLRQLYRADASAKKLIDMAMRLEGVPRHTSTHAAGVIISAFPIEHMVPMQYNDETIVTQYTMNTLESLGLLKFDFLGLRNLTVIRDCVREIHKREPDFSIENVPLDDPEVYRMMSMGETTGVFQFESAGMRRVLMQLQPVNLEDLTAVLSLYRPGPRDSIPKYIENRHHPEKISYAHPLLEPILRVTNGCIVYQEQVMEICRSLAGYSYGRADLVRRAMSKKKRDVMEKEREIFIYGDGESIAGAVSNGVPEETANRIFDEISGFASYAFNKSHAAAYSYLAYQTAYLKKHYFADYMSALMTSVTGDTPKLLSYMNLCESSGVKILPPHVNDSGLVFRRSGNNIRFGLLAVRNLGRSFIEKLIRERSKGGSYTGLRDLCRRMAGKELNKRGLESLICCGALDGLGLNRRQMLRHYESILDSTRDMLQEQLEGQLNLFGETGDNGIYEAPIPFMQEFPAEELLRYEKEFAGMDLSGHPLSGYRADARLLHTTDFAAMKEENSVSSDGAQVSALCVVRHVKKHFTKKGDMMCFMTCEDTTDEMDCIIFPNLFSAVKSKLGEDSVIYISGKLSCKDEDVSLICDSILSAEEVKRKISCGKLCCKIMSGEREKLHGITALAAEYPGKTPLCFYLTDKRKMVAPRDQQFVALSEELLEKLSCIAGEANIGII
ncbi:MAG: DNA polymerase III subunit alpha, partial [Oscillospiraceae bacterium]|nr:DNA polymerase III subunit alpha [Oscillospiraceae bacterium]